MSWQNFTLHPKMFLLWFCQESNMDDFEETQPFQIPNGVLLAIGSYLQNYCVCVLYSSISMSCKWDFLPLWLGSEGQRASGSQDSVSQACPVSRGVLVSGVAWDGRSESWPFLCTPNSSGLSGYHWNSMLIKGTFWVLRISCLLGLGIVTAKCRSLF